MVQANKEEQQSAITVIKAVHTAIFLGFSAALGYIGYAAITRTYTWMLVVSIGLIFFEGLVLLANRGRCPLTTLAEAKGANKGSVTDLFLPGFMARNVFRCSTAVFAVALLAVAIGWFTR